MTRHPATAGKVMLAAWIDPLVRDYVREHAREESMPVSQWIERELMRAISLASIRKLRPGE